MAYKLHLSKVLDRTSRGPRFNSPTGPDFFTISIQCVFVSQCFFIYLINHFTGLYHLFWSSHALFGVSHCLRLAKVKLIGHPQIFLQLHFPWNKGETRRSIGPITLPLKNNHSRDVFQLWVETVKLFRYTKQWCLLQLSIPYMSKLNYDYHNYTHFH